MPKKDDKKKDSKKADAKKADAKKLAAKQSAAEKAAAKKADAKKKDGKKADAKKADGKKDPKLPGAATPATTTGVDEVHVLRLALRDTEARLTETETALRRAQQELADERRAAADAAVAPIEDAIVDAAVAETVAEIVADAEADRGSEGVLTDAVVIEQIAGELDAAADAADVSDPTERHDGEAESAATAFADAAVDAPPEPTPAEQSDERPDESWTLFRLRALARSRHLTGFSTLPKAELLARLRE